MGKRKEITGKDNGKQKMWIIITVIIVFFAMAGYAGMSYYYSDRFFRGTTINGINCSGKTSEEAEQAVAKKAEDYLLEVKARNLKLQSINGKLIGYRYVSDGSISQYLDEQKPYKWVRGFWKKQNYTAKENMTYDKVKLKKQLEKLECVKKENQTAPEDAYVAYKDSKFEIVPETHKISCRILPGTGDHLCRYRGYPEHPERKRPGTQDKPEALYVYLLEYQSGKRVSHKRVLELSYEDVKSAKNRLIVITPDFDNFTTKLIAADEYSKYLIETPILEGVANREYYGRLATSIENKSTIEYETEQGLPALIYGEQGVSLLSI